MQNLLIIIAAMCQLFNVFSLANADDTKCCIAGEPPPTPPEPTPEIPTAWIDLKGDCLQAMRQQIQMEIDACFAYLALGAHFSRDIINRPGFAEIFFKAAAEEREHGSKLIEYLSMRGKLTKGITNLIEIPKVPMLHGNNDAESFNGVQALTLALELETNVTCAIRELIAKCDKAKYYHLVDYLTGVYLEEQYHGQRELAGKLMSLKKIMQHNQGQLGEFLFDKILLEDMAVKEREGSGGSHF